MRRDGSCCNVGGACVGETTERLSGAGGWKGREEEVEETAGTVWW